jgi:hypothetical protein
MTRSQVFVGAGFGVLCLALGGLLAFVLAPVKTNLLNGTDDSPVLARGGSAEFFSGSQWTEITPIAYQTTGVDVTNVSLDGVVPNGSTSPELLTASSLTTNWYMQLTFRDANDAEDANKNNVLLICTSNTYTPPAGSQGPSCSIAGNITTGYPLYLFDAGKKVGFHLPDVKENKYDTLYRLAYNVPTCNSAVDPDDPHCNHIKNITVWGIVNSKDASGNPVTFKDDNGNAVTAKNFLCRGGACDIGFGKQAQ